MTVGQRFILPFQTLLGLTGQLPGATLTFYLGDTDTLAETWQDVDLTVLNANPVTADASGRFGNIFLDPTIVYKVAAADADDVPLWSAFPVQGVSLDNVDINTLDGILEVDKGGSGVGAPAGLEGILRGNGVGVPFDAVTEPAGDLVGTDAAQTLTNKTMTAPTINGGTASGLAYASTKKDNANVDRTIGTLGIVKRAVAVAQTLAQTDNGTCIESTAAGNVLTVPQNSSVALTSDFAVEFYNRTGANVTIVQGAGVTLRLMGGGGLTGNRVLAQWSKCTIEASATLNEFTIAGAGVS